MFPSLLIILNPEISVIDSQNASENNSKHRRCDFLKLTVIKSD